MSNFPSVLNAMQISDRDLIEAVVSQFFILDYGFVDKVNADGTINVTHAVKPLSITGENLSEITTENIEVFSFSNAEISLSFKATKGDKVLLLGLKNPVPSVADVSQAVAQTSRIHYSRETMKALPLCVFNSDSKIQFIADNGKLSINTDDKIELNGNSKQFVTWSELNTALQNLWTSIKSHTHLVSTEGTAAKQSGTAAASTDLETVSLDISNAKTTTVLTGG